jgi:mannosyl-3-phosphoglycerate synthase
MSGKLEGGDAKPQISRVHIHQIETRNPHLHDNKGEEHVQKMRFQALNMLYHSRITPEPIKAALLGLMTTENVIMQGEEPHRERVYPPVGSFDLGCLYDLLSSYAKSFTQVKGHDPSGVKTPGPIDRCRIL